MKTTLKLTNLVKLLFVLVAVSFFGCKDSEDPDPRQAYLRTFEMDDFDIRVISSDGVDSTFEIASSAEIEFEIDGDLDADELKTDLEEFVKDVIRKSLEAFSSSSFTLDIDFEDDAIVEVSGSDFELDDLDFDLTLSSSGSTETYPCDIEGEGELDGGELTFDFEILLTAPTATITFGGTAVGEED